MGRESLRAMSLNSSTWKKFKEVSNWFNSFSGKRGNSRSVTSLGNLLWGNNDPHGDEHFEAVFHRHIKNSDLLPGDKQKIAGRGIWCGGDEDIYDAFGERL